MLPHPNTPPTMTPISLLNWMALSTALLGAWWLCYRVALRQERSFAYNRMYLVLGPVVAAGLPLLPLAWPPGWGAVPAAVPGAVAVLLPSGEVGAGPTSPAAAADWLFWLKAAYVAGAGLMLARLGADLGRLWLSTRRLARKEQDGYTLVRTHGRLPTSSFGRVVLWDETLPLSPAEAAQVLRHELAHVRQGHTYDRLLLELLRAGLWFNPFVHLCGRALALTHEYLADAAALPSAAALSPAHSYAHLLARQVAGRLGFSAPLAHTFSHSQILNRLAMMQKTTPIRRWKQWLALPLVGALVFAVACEQQKEPVAPAGAPVPTGRLDALAPPPPPPPPIRRDTAPPRSPDDLYTYVEQMPQLPGGGGNKAIVEFIQQHLAYPNVAPASRKAGRVFVSFVVTKAGRVQDPKIVNGLSAEYDAAVVAAVQQLPRFTPGRQSFAPKTEEPVPVKVSFTVPITFAN